MLSWCTFLDFCEIKVHSIEGLIVGKTGKYCPVFKPKDAVNLWFYKKKYLTFEPINAND